MLERFNKTTRIIIAVCLAVVIWITGVIIGQEQAITILDPAGGLISNIVNRNPLIEVSLMIDEGNGRVAAYHQQRLTYGQTVFELLKKVSQAESNLNFKAQLDRLTGKVSSFTLAGQKNIQGGPSWTVWLNNNLRPEPINQIKLKARDVVELKYVKLLSNY